MHLVESGARSGGATRYRFDDIVVDRAAHSLLRAGISQPVEPKAFAILLVLQRQPGELIGRDDLLDPIWGRHVTPGVLTGSSRNCATRWGMFSTPALYPDTPRTGIQLHRALAGR